MSIFVILTIVSAIGQLVIAWLLTQEMWLKSAHPLLAGLAQFLGVFLLIYVMASVISGVGTVVLLAVLAVAAEADAPLSSVIPAGFDARWMQWGFGIVVLAPYIFTLLRVIGLVRRGLATRKWQQGQT